MMLNQLIAFWRDLVEAELKEQALRFEHADNQQYLTAMADPRRI